MRGTNDFADTLGSSYVRQKPRHIFQCHLATLSFDPLIPNTARLPGHFVSGGGEVANTVCRCLISQPEIGTTSYSVLHGTVKGCKK